MEAIPQLCGNSGHYAGLLVSELVNDISGTYTAQFVALVEIC
jgi:hypothetical protein